VLSGPCALGAMWRNGDRKRVMSRRSFLAERCVVNCNAERASRERAAPRSQGWPEGQPWLGLSGLPVPSRLRRERLALLEQLCTIGVMKSRQCRFKGALLRRGTVGAYGW
jgi:hypothetical protein